MVTFIRLGFVFSFGLLACSGGTGAIGQTDDAAAPPLDGGDDGATATDAGADGTTGDASALGLDTRKAAVTQTVATNAACKLAAFYWEIGDATGALVSGAVGTGVAADTKMPIASASKLVFGAYVVERFKSDLTKIDANAMHMESGYVGLVYDACIGTKSVQACFDAATNSTFKASEVGMFDYNGGHFQKYAIDLGLADDDSAKLTTDIKSLVGPELAFVYGSPQLAGGITTSANDYAAFLRKVINGGLAIHDHLGESAVCTKPGSCATAVYSPAPGPWHYSYAHWVEDDPAGDGAFSSPGAFGFYPWIDATKTYYGIVARHVVGAGSYLESARCGAALRRAFMTGTAQ